MYFICLTLLYMHFFQRKYYYYYCCFRNRCSLLLDLFSSENNKLWPYFFIKINCRRNKRVCCFQKQKTIFVFQPSTSWWTQTICFVLFLEFVYSVVISQWKRFVIFLVICYLLSSSDSVASYFRAWNPSSYYVGHPQSFFSIIHSFCNCKF